MGIVGDRKKGKKRRSTSDRVDALSTADTTRTKRDDREAVRLPLLGDNDYGRNMIGKITGVGFSKRKRAAGNDRRCATEEGGEHDDWIDFRKAGTMVVGASEIGSRLDARPIKSESFSSLVDGRKQKQQREGEREKRFGICKKEIKKGRDSISSNDPFFSPPPSPLLPRRRFRFDREFPVRSKSAIRRKSRRKRVVGRNRLDELENSFPSFARYLFLPAPGQWREKLNFARPTPRG